MTLTIPYSPCLSKLIISRSSVYTGPLRTSRNMKFVHLITSFYLFMSVLLLPMAYNYSKNLQRNVWVSYAMFVNNPQKKLVVSSITTSQVSTISECSLECLNHQECVSVNFGKKDGTKYACELINTDMFQQPDKLSVSEDFDHYNIKVSHLALHLLIINWCQGLSSKTITPKIETNLGFKRSGLYSQVTVTVCVLWLKGIE